MFIHFTLVEMYYYVQSKVQNCEKKAQLSKQMRNDIPHSFCTPDYGMYFGILLSVTEKKYLPICMKLCELFISIDISSLSFFINFRFYV